MFILQLSHYLTASTSLAVFPAARIKMNCNLLKRGMDNSRKCKLHEKIG
ncbi:MAG: hypothetical protein JWQ40_615 [Segetibacter sp.]|nr:hypothetical protein [Segetibacter sp.]